jgi:hypothetical protein
LIGGHHRRRENALETMLTTRVPKSTRMSDGMETSADSEYGVKQVLGQPAATTVGNPAAFAPVPNGGNVF